MPADWLDSYPGVLRDEPLAGHSQFGIGGRADWFLRTPDASRLCDLRARCTVSGVPLTLVGAGSNTLILDGGIRGLVVQLADRRLRSVDGTTVELSAGYMLPRAALDLARRGLGGMEFGIGVPGTCGASVRGNAGAFGTEIKDVLLDCDAVDPQGEVHRVDNAACDFSYRRSAFATGGLRDHLVLTARFRVVPGDPAEIRARTDDVTAGRKASQPWGRRSLGSVFKNPPGDHAGRLVEACDLKGTRVGGAEISRKHANFILNADGASAADVLALVRLAHDTVLQRFGVELEPEIVTLGEPG